jgi:hypothetical protein
MLVSGCLALATARKKGNSIIASGFSKTLERRFVVVSRQDTNIRAMVIHTAIHSPSAARIREGWVIRSASVYTSSTAKNAAAASYSTFSNWQHGISRQGRFAVLKQSITLSVISPIRTTSPRRISSGDRASVNPPPMPRWVARYHSPRSTRPDDVENSVDDAPPRTLLWTPAKGVGPDGQKGFENFPFGICDTAWIAGHAEFLQYLVQPV